MGNFEKLGILVIIVLVVVIIVVAAWGVRSDPTTDAPLAASTAGDRSSAGSSGESAPSPHDPDADDRRARGGESRGGEEVVSGGEEVEVDPPPVRPVPVVRPKRFHVVKSGESPWKIAARYYGKGHLWPRIEKANPTIDFDPLAKGKKILIPYLEEEQPAPTPRREAREVVAGGRTYVIRDGDTLWDIAKDQLGDATRHPEILEHNPDLNEHRLREGTTIRLPAR